MKANASLQGAVFQDRELKTPVSAGAETGYASDENGMPKPVIWLKIQGSHHWIWAVAVPVLLDYLEQHPNAA